MEWMQYPPEQASRSGCKVSWNYYASEADAKACSIAAINNGQMQMNRGYDFGYCAPGSVRKPEPGSKVFYPDLYEVCLP